jgi:hypothetical protein
VLVEVVDEDDGIHGVVQERLDIPLADGAQRRSRLLATLVDPLAHRDHLHPGLLGEAGQGGAPVQPQHADANGHQPALSNPIGEASA